MRSEEEQIGWICEFCEAPGRCIVIDRLQLRYPLLERFWNKPYECTYKNKHTTPYWNPFRRKHLKRILNDKPNNIQGEK